MSATDGKFKPSPDESVSFSYTTQTFTLTPVLLPGALPLFATGLGALGLLGWRRKRKTQVV